jgi:hypothetical protein
LQELQRLLHLRGKRLPERKILMKSYSCHAAIVLGKIRESSILHAIVNIYTFRATGDGTALPRFQACLSPPNAS